VTGGTAKSKHQYEMLYINLTLRKWAHIVFCYKVECFNSYSVLWKLGLLQLGAV